MSVDTRTWTFSALCQLDPALGVLGQEAYLGGCSCNWPDLLERLSWLVGPGRHRWHPVLSTARALDVASAALLHERHVLPRRRPGGPLEVSRHG